MLTMKWFWFVLNLMQILSIFLKLQAVKQSGHGFLAYPVGQMAAAWLRRSSRKVWPSASSLSRSLEVIGTDTDRSVRPTCDFLWVFYTVSIGQSRIIFEIKGNICQFPTAVHLTPPLRVSPWIFVMVVVDDTRPTPGRHIMDPPRRPPPPPPASIAVMTTALPIVVIDCCGDHRRRQRPTTARLQAAAVSTSSRRNLQPVRQYR